jgi:hypothetical protein
VPVRSGGHRSIGIGKGGNNAALPNAVVWTAGTITGRSKTPMHAKFDYQAIIRSPPLPEHGDGFGYVVAVLRQLRIEARSTAAITATAAPSGWKAGTEGTGPRW